MFAISINYKNVKTEIRESYAFDREKAVLFLQRLGEDKIAEAVYLNTCNRAEVYGNGNYEAAVKAMAEFAGVDPSSLREDALIFEGKSAIRHLFRVTAGMESMVVGEDEVLGQMRDAYELSRELGFTGYCLNKVFQAALTAAKKVKTDTGLSKSSVSVATIAAAKCHKFINGHKTILVIGASGDTGSKLVKNLLSYKDSTIYATVRNRHVTDLGLTLVPYEERYRYIAGADVIISSTRSPHYTVTYSKLKREKLEEKPRLFVDLAVPRDIDEDVLRLAGSALITINDIEALAKENNEIKKSEVVVAEEILEEAVDELLKTLYFHEFLHAPDSLQKKDTVKKEEQAVLSKFVYRYRDIATADEFLSFLQVLKRMEETE